VIQIIGYSHDTPSYIPQFVILLGYNLIVQLTKGQKMTLEEYKQMVEAQRLTSLAIALDALTKSKAIQNKEGN
jgi:hypothetical protein